MSHRSPLAGGRRAGIRTARRRRQETAASVAVTAAVTGIAVLASIGSLPALGAQNGKVRPSSVQSVDVVVNGTFADSVSGWRTNDKATQLLTRATAGHAGGGSAQLTGTVTTHVVLNESVNSVAATVKGGTYSATAWVRALKPNLAGALRLREAAGGSMVGVDKATFQLNDTAWHKVTVNHVAVQAGATIDLNVLAWNVGSGEGLLVDDVALLAPTGAPAPKPSSSSTTATVPSSSAPATTTPSPTTSAPAPTTSAPAPTTSAPAPTTSAPAPASTSPAPTTPAPSPSTRGRVTFGMSAPADQWNLRVSEVGPGLRARRIFLTGFTASLGKAEEALAAGMYPVISFKTGGYSWADVAAGRADGDLQALARRLDALPGPVFVAVHHEPENDGAAAEWAAMQVHALPVLDAPDNVDVGVIGNGWWWSAQANGKDDAYIATYLTPGVRAVSDVIAADTYHGGSEDAGVKIARMSAWATRVGVTRLGIGEFNGGTGAAITNAMNAVKADPRFGWACVYNSDIGIGEVLVGERLTAFQQGLL